MMDELDLGPRLRTLREKRQLSLREVARRSSIAVSFLSGLEAGRNNVSVANLKTILDSLGTTLGEFFQPDGNSRTRVVYRKDELTEIAGPTRGISFKEVAAGRPGRALQLLVERYEPGCDTGSEGYRHQAEEAGVVLKGMLELTVDGQTYVLRAGDAYYFDSRLPHRFRNTGRTAVEAVSVNTPPSF
jgi:transcriptional regulator with XRE-family HTH domain